MAPSIDGYAPVDSEENPYTINEEIPKRGLRSSRWPRTPTIILSITTLILGLLSLYLSFQSRNACSAQESSKNGYPTEWGPARELFAQKTIQSEFTGAFRYNETSKTYYRALDSVPQYIGTPRPEIDEAWEELLAGQYIVLPEEEALELDNPVAIQGVYIAEVEVMHSLHCLNAVRMAVYHEYYSIHNEHKLPEDLDHIHLEHCFEQLRQTIQCSMDLTPVPLRPYGGNLIGTPQVHTCRDWDAFRSWYTARGQKYGRVEGGGI